MTTKNALATGVRELGCLENGCAESADIPMHFCSYFREGNVRVALSMEALSTRTSFQLLASPDRFCL